MRILLTAATLAMALTATPAHARSGYGACVAIQPSKNRLLWTNPVAAEESSMAALHPQPPSLQDAGKFLDVMRFACIPPAIGFLDVAKLMVNQRLTLGSGKPVPNILGNDDQNINLLRDVWAQIVRHFRAFRCNDLTA